MRDETTPVLIVGGGPAGLSASLFLSWFGTPSVLIERHAGTSIHPRAWGWYPRTLELFRATGVSAALLRESEGFSGHNLNGKVESLTGREISLSRIPEPEDVNDTSPIPRIISLPQDRMEPILRRRAEELGGDLRFRTELTGLTHDADGVTATVRGGDGVQRTIDARYVIAADGAHGRVADQLGIARRGRGTMRHQISILFRADLRKHLNGRRFAVCQVDNERVQGVLGHDDTLKQGTLIVTYHPERGERPEDFTDERCIGLVRAAIGDPRLDVRLRSVLPWDLADLIADRFARGRVFLVGDAAHVMPPVGGYGANTAIQDAHNLAWKLHNVLTGAAGPGLLETYDLERRPVAAATTAQAGLRLAVRGGFATPEQAAALTDTLSVTTGYRYDSPAIVAPDGTAHAADDTRGDAVRAKDAAFVHPRHLSGVPGTRAPHVTVERHGRTISTLDLFDRHAVLLGGEQAPVWCDHGRQVARRLNITLDVYRFGRDVEQRQNGRPWREAYGVTASDAVLVRPDGFVCWRSDPSRAPSGALLERVLRTMLSRGQDAGK